MDSNNDMWIDEDEIEEYSESCVTTYDPFDRDGDGVPDKDDAFPDDPDEDTDTDGDGIGDNADIIASVDNDVMDCIRSSWTNPSCSTRSYVYSL